MTGRTIIVGAGPAGLAVAAMLGQRGITYTLLERADSIGAAWRNRYDGLRLHTVRGCRACRARRSRADSGAGSAATTWWPTSRTTRGGSRSSPSWAWTSPGWSGPRAVGGWRPRPARRSRSGSCWRPVIRGRRTSRTGPASRRSPGRSGTRSTTGSRRRTPVARCSSSGSGNSASEIAVELSRVAAEVQLSVRTPPNIVRRATLGVPSQLIAVALRWAPDRVMNPLSSLLRRLTVPDLSGYGLPAPGRDGYSQYRRSRVIPILDHGFVDAVRAGRITIVSAVQSFDGDRGAAGRRPNGAARCGRRRHRLSTGSGGILGDVGVLDDSGGPRVHGAGTVDGAPGLYFVGISVELSGQLLRISREAEELSKTLASA